MVVNQYSSLVLNRCEIFTLRMMLSLILLVVLPTYVVPENLHHVFSEQLQASVLETAFPATDGNGRSSQAGLARYKSILESRLVDMLDKDGWIPARVLAKAISLDIDFSGLNKSVVPIRGQVTKCHSSPVCLDLACGKCFDPLTSLHGSCGHHSFFKCTNLLPEVCLPWTCATSSTNHGVKPLLRNFLPRDAGCASKGSLQLVGEKDHTDSVELIGLGLTLNALTACSEQPMCWDQDCELCYDPLEEHHASCPDKMSVPSCSSLPYACQPFLCWPKNTDVSIQKTTVFLRDYQQIIDAC